MIPYELIVPSASRPHLLEQVLGTLLARVDQMPERVLVHNDERFPGRRELVDQAVRRMVPPEVPVWLEHHDPPIKHGPALHRLLSEVRTEYVVYSQDDHVVVRPLPVRDALDIMARSAALGWGINQIRFNKRDTMDKKGEFVKVQKVVPVGRNGRVEEQVLCVADHWYFQTGVWRVAAIKPVVDWWATDGGGYGAFDEHCEVKINQVFNGEWRGRHPDWPTVPVLQPGGGAWNDPEVRSRVQRTFIWGKVGEPAFVQHIGHNPEDWALERANRDPVERREAKGQP